MKTDDDLLASLRALPNREPAAASMRPPAPARAAYREAFRQATAASPIRRALLPAALASVCGVYLSWAIAMATMLGGQ